MDDFTSIINNIFKDQFSKKGETRENTKSPKEKG